MQRTRSASQYLPLQLQWCVISAVMLLAMTSASAFQMMMNYKPPLKSSVKKLYHQRSPSNRHPEKRTSQSSKSAFAGVYAPQPSPAPSFERRMRDLVLGSPTQQRESSRRDRRRNLPSNLQHVETLQDYKSVVGDEKDKIVAVRFFASYCKACQAVEPHFYSLASRYPDVVFVDVPVTSKNAALHRGLGVPSVPFGHIYHPQGGLVEELKLTRKHIAGFRQKIDSYVKGSCELPEC